MTRLTNVILNVMSLVLVVVGIGLVGTFFFGTPVANTALGQETTAPPDDFNVPVVSEEQQREATAPKKFDPKNVVAPVPEDKSLKLTIPQMARVDDSLIPYAAGDDEERLKDNAAIHLAGTGFPWEKEANVYVAGHRLGYPNTGSFLAFFDLNRLQNGDEVYVTDANGKRYTYRVFNTFRVSPTDVQVTRPVEGKNVLTLQTCTLPDYTQRLIVRAEKVA